MKQALKKDLQVSFGDNQIRMEIKDLRRELRYFPMERDPWQGFDANNPLIAIIAKKDKSYQIQYGNNRLTFLRPQYFEYDRSLDGLEMEVDGVRRFIPFGSTVSVGRDFLVQGLDGYRVNVIGFTQKGVRDESGLEVSEEAINHWHSIDREGKVFRVEVYRGKRFSGMVLVDFRRAAAQKPSQLAGQVEEGRRPLSTN